MKNLFVFVLIFIFISAYSQTSIITPKKPSPYSKQGITIADDYSWLENIKSPETIKWVDDENIVTSSHMGEIEKIYDFERKITEYNSYRSRNLPKKKRKYFYSEYINKKNNLSSLYYRTKLDDRPTELVNLNYIYPGTSALLNDYYPSHNSTILAYEVSLDGSDNHEIRFVNIPKKQNLDDIILNVKFSKAAWDRDFGIFYKKNNNLNVIAADSTNQLFYHRLGTKQGEDKLIFDNSKIGGNFSFYTMIDKLIIVHKNKEETASDYYQASLVDSDFTLVKFLENETRDIRHIDYDKGKVYFSSKEFDWGEIRSFELNNKEEQKVIVPQIYSQLLVSPYFTDDYIFCRYKTIGKYYIRVYDILGNFIRKFDSPDGSEFTIDFYDKDSKNLFVSMESYIQPAQFYKLNIATGDAILFVNEYVKAKPTIFPLGYFEVKNISFKSRDNKDVPITIVYKKGTLIDGNNPTLLSAYGGFGIVTTPRFSPGLLCFLEKGGVYAFAEIRGGGEKGTKWEKDGKGLKKMNSFNDFIDAAEYLIKEKYTSQNKLGISGASYGGLVVGVAMTKRPDLFKVVISEMGGFDMIKFDQFTNGKYHLDEYGDPNKKDGFDSLLGYSPYHNIDDKTNYPTTLIITSENDNRVPPLHSYKFAARLQNRESQKNAIYLETFKNSGHSGNISTYDNYLKTEVDYYSFLLYHLNN